MIVPDATPGQTDWFVRARFGLFIHWGLYALPARHEWVASNEQLAPDAYRRYFERFDPDLFDPQGWAKAAKSAGMKYFVVTTKHHDGFCLWDSQFTDWKITNTPFGRDALREIVEAFRAEELRVGFYYSLIDWHHPDFTLDLLHPQRLTPDPQQFDADRDMTRYAAYMRDQIRELLTQFGPIDVLWTDFSYPERSFEGERGYPMKGKGRADWESEKLLKLVRELAPDIIINNRLDLPDVPADVHTPEQFQPREWVRVEGKPVVWEACQTLSGSWGYHRDETTWKSAGQLVRMLIDTVSKGGNLLMNVGPTGRGNLDERALDALRSYGDWMKWHERSIVGCTQSEFLAPGDVRFTQNFAAKRLYVHLLNYPFLYLHLPGLQGLVEYAQFLNDASEIPLQPTDWTAEPMQKEKGDANVLSLQLPIIPPPVEVPVIELFLK